MGDLDSSLRLFTAKANNNNNNINVSFNNNNNNLLQLFGSKEEEVAELEKERVANKLRSFRYYTREEEEEEERKGVSTRLTLYDDPWKIKKVLRLSDVNKLCRLMVPKNLVHQHIIPAWRRCGKHEDIRDLEDNREIHVKVWDFDRSQEYKLTLRKHGSSDCYVFRQNWNRQFVVERGLKNGDTIGMFWCSYGNRFCFRLLDRAPN